MLGLAREIAMFEPTIDAVVRGDPAAILFVEFAEDDQGENVCRLGRLNEMIGDLGLAWANSGAKWGGVIEVLDPKLQAAITEMRTAGLNIMMSMKEEGKPISFVEDCAVPLEHLADYTSRLTAIFEKHGTRGTWYAHASVGCLHVRPVLNLRLGSPLRQGDACGSPRKPSTWCAPTRVRIRASTATASCAGIPRDDVRAGSRGARVRGGQGELRSARPLQSGQDRDAPEFDDRTLFRYPPDYRLQDRARLDWSRPSPAPAAVSRARSRCATITAPAARSPAA